MRAVITVIGHDAIGIIAEVTATLSKNNVNVLDISQSVLQDFFAMVMLVDISKCEIDFDLLRSELTEAGKKKGVNILAMHEDIFNSMHRI